MKNLTKIIALAMIAVFAVVSCAPPEASITEYDWTVINARNDPNQNDTNVIALPNVVTTLADAENPQIVINFPNQADFLRKINFTNAAAAATALQTFMTFHNFTNPGNDNFFWVDKGETSTLTDVIPYTFIRRNGTQIRVELTKDFTTGTADYSNLVMKIDGSAYTHSNGIKMDRDNDGVAGEAIYDDLYIEIPLQGAKVTTSDTDNWTFIAPGTKYWNISITNQATTEPDWGVTTTSETSVTYWLRIANINLSNGGNYVPISNIRINETNTDAKAVYKKVGDQFAPQFKLQKLAADRLSWTDVKTAEYDDSYGTANDAATTIGQIIIKDITYDHMGIYRVVWTGAARLKTTDSFFGAQQKVFITGNSSTAASYREDYAQTIVFSNIRRTINSSLYREITAFTSPFPSLLSMDHLNRNVVLRVQVPIQGDGSTEFPYVGLDRTADLKNKVEIVYRPNNVITGFDHPDLVQVKIEDVEYTRSAASAALPVDTVYDVMYITLDPRYHYRSETRRLTLLINDGLRYTGTNPIYAFGNTLNFGSNNYRRYDASFPAL